MKTNTKNDFIIWAVDPNQNPKSAKRVVQALKTWSKALSCEILPVTIFSKSNFNMPSEMIVPQEDTIPALALKTVTRYLKSTSIKKLLPPVLIFTEDLSTRKKAIDLAKYAEKVGARIIVADTQAKKSWNPWRLGGFAETLSASSRVPVLLLNPSVKESSKLKTIFFPSDFSRSSKAALEALIPIAKSFKSKVLLYNQIETPKIYPSEFSDIWKTQMNNMELILQNIHTTRAMSGTELSEHLAKNQVTSSVLIQRQKTYLSADVLAAAKRNKADLIAVVCEGGPFSQSILGSVARDVLQQAQCPVLIFYRPRLIRANKKLLNRKARTQPGLRKSDDAAQIMQS